MTYKCLHCSRTFATPYSLKRHISDKHQYINEQSNKDEEAFQSNVPYEEPGLWDDDDKEAFQSNMILNEDDDKEANIILNEEAGLWDDDDDYIMNEDENREATQTHETSLVEENDERNKESEESSEEINEEVDETDEEIVNLTFPLSIDEDDFCGTTLDDAINDKMHPPTTEWPNEIYREFMDIVMEYKLSNSCGDRIIKLIDKSKNFEKNPLPKNTKEGRKFLDTSEFPYMKFKKAPITKFQDVDYYFYYQPIIHGIKALLLQPDISKEFVFKYRNTSVKTYGEQFESNWWNITEANIPIDNQLLSVMIYADSTTCDHLGKTSEHPIYISFGNIPNWQRNKPDAKVLVGYFPKLKSKDNITKNSEPFRRLQRQTFQRCLQILLSPILNRNDMYLVVNNEIYLFTPKISVILADMAEAGAFTATYLPSTSKRPCCYCLINNNNLNNMTLPDHEVIIRTPEKMKEVIDTNQANEFSIHTEFNFFWKFKDFNIYEATVPDRMHLLDLGITKYLLEFTRTYLQLKVSNKAVKDMDHRLCVISRYPGLIILKNGLENISKFTANDYRNIMKVVIFVIDNLYDNYKEGGIPCKRLCNVFYNYLNMYMKLRQETFTETDLTELEVNINN
jgi:hypothetical protein